MLASFVKDKVSIGVWIYLWAFYFVPLICISVFVPVPYCLDDCGFVVEPEVRQMDSLLGMLFSWAQSQQILHTLYAIGFLQCESRCNSDSTTYDGK